MPTLFGRRYMRDSVPTAEIVIGVVVLLLLGGIVVAAITIGTRPQPALFERKPGVERKSLLTREMRIARQMMPALGTAGWSLQDNVRVSDRSALEAAGETEWVEAGATWVYRGVYAKPSSRESVSVQIVDAETPANAFGLYRQREPREADPLAMGNEGWQAQQRGAFWAGRYYTEFDRSNVRSGEPSIRTIADTLGSAQIAYGAPFWAESVLPQAGRIPESFTFVKRRAAGFDFLHDAFVATYPNDVTAFVADAGSFERAADMVRQFQALLTERGRVQSSPSTPEAPILAGDFEHRQLAVFHAETRVCGAVGGDMEPVSAVVRQMLDAVRPQGGTAAQAVATRPPASPFPTIDLPDWEPPAEFREYTPLNLWEKIDGRAEIYLQFDMQRMHFGTYHHRADPRQFIDVYGYEMAAPEGAFGIYQAEGGGHVIKLDVGDEGYSAGGSVIFRKGTHYVRVEANGEGATTEAAGLAIARAIAGRISGTAEKPWAEALLPRDGRTSEALAYHGADAFSLDFLSDVFSADYAVDDKTFTMFIHRAAEEAEAVKLLDAYAAFFKAYGRLLERGHTDGIEWVVGESGGTVDAAFAVGVYLGGVNNCADAVMAKERALAFARTIAAQSTPPRSRSSALPPITRHVLPSGSPRARPARARAA
ncbi:MAG: DUF6599 family protein [Planctomycetota bacterium]